MSVNVTKLNEDFNPVLDANGCSNPALFRNCGNRSKSPKRAISIASLSPHDRQGVCVDYRWDLRQGAASFAFHPGLRAGETANGPSFCHEPHTNDQTSSCNCIELISVIGRLLLLNLRLSQNSGPANFLVVTLNSRAVTYLLGRGANRGGSINEQSKRWLIRSAGRFHSDI